MPACCDSATAICVRAIGLSPIGASRNFQY